MLQNHSRKSKIPIDQLKFDFIFLHEPTQEKGIFIDGLSIDGAQFNIDEQTLIEPES